MACPLLNRVSVELNMKTVAFNEPENLTVTNGNRIQFPFGLLGFEQIKEYELLADPAEEPFMWLQMLNATSQSFLVVPPSTIVPDYHPNLSPEDVEFLELREPGDVLLLNIVTLRGRQQATINLKGPIVINRHSLIGKQVIPLNVANYSLQFPLQ